MRHVYKQDVLSCEYRPLRGLNFQVFAADAGGDSLSQAAETSIHLALQTENCRCIALRLHDDLTDTDPDSYRGAKAFRDIFPSIDALPFFMALGPDGKEIARLEGEDIRIQLAETMRLATGSHAGSTEVLSPPLNRCNTSFK